MNPVKILVVDDETKICQNVKKILSKKNCVVTFALNAEEALEQLTKDSFSLLISDIVMPGKNGLELLKLVKQQWPLTKAVIMTAYASTDTAMKAIRLGALDYIPKPFTPEELRSKVDKALAGELVEVQSSDAEREMIDVIDLDAPFEAKDVADATGEEYVKMLGRSDMPVVEVKLPATLPNFCAVGTMVCDIFKKLGATCKAGSKSGECPQLKAKKAKPAAAPAADQRRWLGPDLPFDAEELAAAAGPDYVKHLYMEDRVVMPYEKLKETMSARLKTQAARREAVQPRDDLLRVLVIDDEVAVNNNIRKILAKKGYEIEQATSKAEALHKLQGGAYGLVILDLKMPGVKGLELLGAVRERQPAARVIIVTGYASIETAVEGARMGAVGYVPKPFTPVELRNAAEKAVRLAA
jgi:DNA-binding response OmpR family regulator